MDEENVSIHKMNVLGFITTMNVWPCRYKEGALRAKQGLGESSASTIGIAVREIVSLSELEGHESVEETDIDELLSWTNGLNYDQSVE